ncbi:N-6 DNA methylase [Vreelandella sp. GE22]
MNTESHSQLAAFIWSVADLLRGDFKLSQYGRIILPFTLLRRLECVLEPTKQTVVDAAHQHRDKPDGVREQLLLRASVQPFYNASKLTLGTLSSTQTANDLMSYVQSFSQDAREIFEHFEFESFVHQLNANDLLYEVVKAFAKTDLSPARLSNFGMGLVFEELIRKFAESSNETAGEHFTPRDIVHLTTSLVLTHQDAKLKSGGIVTVYDPTAGTGGFLSESDEYIQQVSGGMSVSLHGQELNPESYAICKADMLVKGQEVRQIKLGNTLANDQLAGEHFDFMLSNPPFGVEWKKVQKQVIEEHKQKGYNGRFGPGLPRVSDGSLLFLMHLVSKMRPAQQGGSRIGIILNGSPLFTGGAGSGESEIRRYLLQHDMVEAIIGLPTDMFYNTGIATYVWILSNAKPAERRGKVQLINATGRASKMRKSLGSKRQYVADDDIEAIVRLYGQNQAGEESKIFPVEAFGYRRITVERPLRLNFQASPERLAKLDDEKPFQKLDEAEREAIKEACATLDPDERYTNRDVFTKALKAALKAAGLKIGAPVQKALLNAFSERDPDADACKEANGRITSDVNLRVQVYIPIGEIIDEKAFNKITADFDDAWVERDIVDPIDGQVGLVGYEINFSSFFIGDFPKAMVKGLNAEWLRFCDFASPVKGTDDSCWDLSISSFTGKVLNKYEEVYSAVLGNNLLFKIKKDVVYEEYLKIVLEGPIWKKGVLENFSKMGFRTLSYKVLEQVELPIPSLEIQNEMVDFFVNIDKKIVELQDNKEKVWLAPYIRRFSIDSQRPVEQLADVLPYPLANLLHHQENTNGGYDKEKYELILKFLECVSQYFCAVLISITNDAGIDILSVINKNKKQFNRSGGSFGFWVRFIEEINNTIKALNEKAEIKNEAWKEFLDEGGPIFSALPVLIDAKNLRNDKVGHGAYPTYSEAAKTLQYAEKYLEDFSACCISFFSQVELVRPGLCSWDGVSYKHEIEKFSGVYAYPFLRDFVVCRKPLRYGSLHIFLKEYERIVEIPGLLIMLSAVNEADLEGFFFLGKKEKNGFLYLCHQQLPIQQRIETNRRCPFLIN